MRVAAMRGSQAAGGSGRETGRRQEQRGMARASLALLVVSLLALAMQLSRRASARTTARLEREAELADIVRAGNAYDRNAPPLTREAVTAALSAAAAAARETARKRAAAKREAALHPAPAAELTSRPPIPPAKPRPPPNPPPPPMPAALLPRRLVLPTTRSPPRAVPLGLGGRRDLPNLSPELLQEHSNVIPGQPRRVVLSIYSDFRPGTNQATMLLNWVRTMKALDLRCLVAVCQRELSVEAVQPLLAEADGWCGAFNGSGLEACADNPKVGRWDYVKRILALGFDSLTSDADISWQRNPLEYFGALLAAHPAADVLSSTDANDGHYLAASLPNGTRLHSVVRSRAMPGVADTLAPRRWETIFPHFPLADRDGVVRKPELEGIYEREGIPDLVRLLREARGAARDEVLDLGLEEIHNCGAQFNTGIMLWRATDRSVKLLEKSWELMMRPSGVPVEKVDDQRPVNVVMRQKSRMCAWDEMGDDGSRLEDAVAADACGGDALLHPVWGGKACMGLLPVVQFANGFVYTAMRAHEQYGVQPFAFHATYSADKLMKLREEGVFRDSPQRWMDGPVFGAAAPSPVRVLTYDVDIPRELLFPPLVNGELSAWSHVALVQYQIALFRNALAIAHVLGRTIQLPHMACSCECFYFVGRNCTIEGHRMRLPYVCPTDHWLRRGGANLGLPYVEPGFLDNPLRPAASRKSVAHVQLCGGADDPPCDAVQPATGVVLLPRGADAAALRKALGSGAAADAVELRLESVAGAWGGFAPTMEREFTALISRALSGWCCFHNSSNGVLFHTTRRDIIQFQINYRWDWNGNNSEVVPHGEGMEAGACAA